MLFAKAMSRLGVTERSSVAIMGFNSAQWFIAFMGTILNNCVITGIYATNSDDASMYQADHSEAEVVVVENLELLARFDRSKLPRVKAYVLWAETLLPTA